MALSPHLSFDGHCAEAFTFYERCLGGRITMMMTHGNSPAATSVSPDWRDKIMHARLEIGGEVLMGMDAPPPYYAKPQGMTVTLTLPSAGDAERVFEALAENGRVTMPFQKTFWSPGFGTVVDRFGIPWMINSEPAA